MFERVADRVRRWPASRGLRWTLALAAFVLAAARLTLPIEPGLNGEYIPTLAPGAAPAMAVVDREQTTDTITGRWPGFPPDGFRIRWYGYLAVPADGEYTFAVTADDAAVLSIDDATVVDTGGGSGVFRQTGTARLAGGVHAIRIEYTQGGGDYAFDWSWSSTGEAGLTPVPAYRLMPRRGAWPLQRAATACGWLSLIAFGLCVVAWALAPRSSLVRSARRHPAVALLVLFVALAIVQTWPLATDPAHLSRNNNGDTVLNEWALAWVAHQAVRDPLHLFDANIFYPERYTLAYSESMLPQAALAAPLLWAGASPVLAYNLVLIAGFALNGWVMALVIRAWTGDTAAGVLSGILFAFNAHIFTRLPHMQAQHVEFLPLALLALDRVVSAPRVRDAAAFGAMVALQALTSVYLAMFTVCAMTAAFVVRPGDWMATTWRRVWSHLVLAGGVAAAIATPFMLPYLFVHNVQGFERSLDEVATMSATLTSYLSTPGRLHYALWSHRWFGGPAVLFPGVTATLLGALAVVTGTAWRDRRARMCLAVGVCGVLLSFGPKLPGYSVLFAVVPLFRVVRVVASIGYLGLVGLAMVAGFGMVDLRRRVTPAVWPLIASVVFVCATIEPMAAPLELIRAVPPAGIYDLLRDEKDAVVVELPFHTEAAGFAQVAYMMNSTRHWRPMLNGYSGYRPDSYYRSAEMLEGFPSARSMAWLREQGVTHVFAHLHELDADARERLDATAGLRRVAISRGIALLRLDPLR